MPPMNALTLLLAASLSQAPAKLDISADKAKLAVVTDGKQHYVVYNRERGYEGPNFFGDGKTFHKLRIRGGGAVGTESFDFYFWEPRIMQGVNGNVSFAMKDSGKKFTLTCGRRETPFTPVAAEEAKKLLDGAEFVGPLWTRLPERLLRDDKGTYFFIDRLRTEESHDRRDFRLFVGARGKMKAQNLKDIVDDSEGMIFSTRDGQLRLVAATPAPMEGAPSAARGGPAQLKWIVGKAETLLVEVPLDDSRNVRMLYMDLGVYDGQRLGTPCDELM